MKLYLSTIAVGTMPPVQLSRVIRCMLQLGALTSLSALAAPDQVIRPYVGYAIATDDNVLGVDRSGDAASSTSRRAEAGVLLDKRIGRQALSAALHLTQTTYEQLPELDNDGKDLRLNWNWHLGNHFDGNIGASYVQALAPFVNFHDRERNLRSERREFADGGWLLHPSWRLRTGVSRDTIAYDLAAQQAGNRVEHVGELGLDYLARSGSTIGTQLRHTRGQFPNRQQIDPLSLDNSYDQDELKAKVNWLITGKTQLQFLGGLVQRKHDAFAARDYRGFNARLNANWQASAKLGVALAGWREIGALDDVTASYTLNQGVSLGAAWDVTEKLRVDGQLKHETSDYSGTATIASALSERKDSVRRASFGLVYKPTAHLRLSAQAYHAQRRSTLAGNSYPTSGLLLNSRYEF
ncbi:MAG TPA: XrtB/PEP-CTERM-associated polysaccharide biosynthesis outer membrane protein EpsL [Telluria sp.]